MKTAGLIATTALAGLLIPAMATARLGETIRECDARYGKPTQVDTAPATASSLERTYVKEGFTIEVLFVDGRAETISYLHPSGFTSEQITKLLNNNARGEVWDPTPNGSSSVYGSWETSKGATALYFKQKPWESRASSQYCLKISSSTFGRLVNENTAGKKDQKEKKAEAAKRRAEAAKQRAEQEERERLKRLDTF